VRTPFIAGNWKMNLRRADVDAFCAGMGELCRSSPGVKVGLFPPFVYLPHLVEALAGTPAVVGAQTCHPASDGAFTGEVSAPMIRDVGASHCLVGHSERRTLFGERDADVRARLEAALDADLDVVVCLGETLDEREAGRTETVVTRQLEAGLSGLAEPVAAGRVSIAYEPVWAIGTGRVATPAQAQEAHAVLRARAATLLGRAAADALVIQYGGSVKPDNVADLMACPDVDGALVGGASLTLPSFTALVRFEGVGSAS